MTDIGLSLRTRLPVKELVALAREAEGAGFHSVWVTEGFPARDAITAMTAVACHTRRIHVASGIIPIYFRSPGLSAMTSMISGDG